MSAPLRSLLRRLALRIAIVGAWLAVDALAARWLGAWDAGFHLLAGGRSAGYAAGLMLGFFAFHVVTYFVLPPVIAVSCVRVAARYLDEARAGAG